MRKIYVVLIVLLCSWQLTVAQCTLTNSTGCSCLGGGTNCDLVPDITVSRKPLTQSGSSGVIEYSQSGNGSNDGLLRISVTTPNIGHGPMETRSTNIFVCGTDTIIGTAPSTCPDGVSIPKILINQRIYHKNGGTMSFYDRAAGTMTYHPTHGHQHVDNWGVYTLRTQTTDPNPLNWPIVGNGAKLAFCLLDIGNCVGTNNLCIADNGDTLNLASEFYGNHALGGGNYGCSTTLQGISVGYYDTYVQSLDGMYIVIPPGTCNGNYYIVAQQDPYNQFLEENDNNNVMAVPYTLTKQAGTIPVISASGATTFCTGGSVILTSTSATSYLWSNGATTQSITVNQSGTYSCTVDGASACPATSSPITVTVNPMTVNATASSTAICNGASVQLNSTATGIGVGNQLQAASNNTVYNIPDNNSTGVTSTIAVSGISPSTLISGAVVSVTANITHTYDGDLEVRLISPSGQNVLLSNRRGGSGNNFNGTTFSMSASTPIASGAPPFSGTYIPDGNLNSFTGNANGNWQLKVIDLDASDVGTINSWTFRINTQVPTTMSYSWTSNPLGFNSSIQNPSATPVANTTYTVTAIESITGCTGSSSVLVNVSNPVVSVNGTNTICAGQSTTLTASGANTYSWSPSTGLNTSSGPSVIANPSSTTTYTITGTNTGGCTDTETITITVNPLPTVTATNVSGCAGTAIALSGSPSGGTFSLPNPYTGAATTYTYSYTNGNGCSNTSSPATITVNSLPTATTTPAGTVTTCNTSQLLTANSGGSLNYQWKLNGNNVAGATSITYNATSSGNYSVLVTDANGCFTTSAVVTLALGTGTPAITVAGSTTICEGTAVTLNATPGATSYQWYKNAAAQAGATSASYTTSSSGNYYCAITSTGCSGNSNTISVTVINNPAPTVSYITSLSFCPPGSVVLTANTFSGVTSQWQKNSIDIAGATSQTYTANTSGKYRVKETANGCTKQGMDVTVSAAASSVISVITANGPTTFCQGGSVLLSVTNAIPGYGFQWQNNNVSISGATSNSYSATATGNYTCIVTATCGTATSNSIPVTTGGISATITPSGTVSICNGSAALLSANTGPGYTFQWQLNGVNINGATSSTYSATVAGNYSVNIISPCGNATSLATQINIAALNASITPVLTTVCEGSAATFTASTGFNYTYQWYRNGSPIAGATNSTLATSQSANYTVIVTQGGVCSVTSNQSTLQVINNPNPVVTAGGPTTFCVGQSVTFTANTFAGVTYQWQKNSVNIAGATLQSYAATTGGQYRVKETANGCTKTGTPVVVTVNCRMDGDETQVNSNTISVSPNPASGIIKLDMTSSASEKTTLHLFNVLGKEVFTSELQNNEGLNSHSLDLSKLNKGIYLLRVDAEKQTIKIVLE